MISLPNDLQAPELSVPGSPRFPRKEFAVGVWLMMALAIIALGIRPSLGDEPFLGEMNRGRGFLEPLTDLAWNNLDPILPPLPTRESSEQAAPETGRARVASPATATARYAYRWTEGHEEIVLLRGRCTIHDGPAALMADEIVIWHDPSDPESVPIVYLAGNARLEQAGQSRAEPAMLTSLTSTTIRYDIPSGGFINQSQVDDPLYQRALSRREASADPIVRSVSRPAIEENAPPSPGLLGDSLEENQSAGEIRRIRIFPRSSIPFNVESVQSTNTLPPEQVTVLTGGVNVLIDSHNDSVDIVDLRADRVVIWTESISNAFESDQVQSEQTPFTVYLEGNVVILQGGREVTAGRAVYDARADRALIHNAELRTYVPELQSDIRVRAETIRQLSRGRFHAQNAWSTTSVFGKPGYRVQSREIFLEPRYDVDLRWLGAGSAVVDPVTGMEMVETNWVRSYGNTVFIRDVPIMYSPYLAGPAEEIKIPLKQLTFGNDEIFGFRVQTAWDPFQLFGLEEPPGVELRLLADYYSKRGPGGGLSGEYSGEDLFGLNDQFRGSGIGYYVHDGGQDRLGRTRNSLPVMDENRWRFQWRHRHNLPGDINVNAELGVVSDRNLLEQYFEPEFDSDKDQENLLYATQNLGDWGAGHWSWELLGKAPLNDFETVTGWYPKADLWGLSEPLLDGWLTWSSHSVAGYGDINPADPFDYQDERFFTPLSYAPEVGGGVFMTRHQLDAPIPIGPLKVVPFAMGEASFWEEGMNGEDLGRLTSSVGVRSSIQFQRVFPQAYNRILGVKGLAHKIRLEGQYRITDTTEPLGAVAQYNEIGDNAQERSRYRFPTAYFRRPLFDGVVPPELDPRFYGVRSGVGTPLGSPYYELIEDQQVVELAIRQRLQTKSGPPGRLRIRDWMTFDTGLSLFPRADRDNFGEEAGLIFADYSWMVSERTRFLADIQTDLFDNAASLWNVGVQTQRTRRGSLYLGLRHVEFATQKSDIIIGRFTYAMSPKWLSSLGASVDIQDTDNITQTATLTRVGADFLIHLGVQNNSTTENFGVTFAIEPRFGNFRGNNTRQLSSLIGPPINP